MKIPKCVILKSYLHSNETVKLLIWIKMGASFLAEAGRNLISGLKMTLIPLSYAVLCPCSCCAPCASFFALPELKEHAVFFFNILTRPSGHI